MIIPVNDDSASMTGKLPIPVIISERLLLWDKQLDQE